MKRLSVVLLGASLAAVVASASSQASGPATVTLVDKQWTCNSPQDGTLVNVTIKTRPIDAIHLDAGCTGSIRVAVTTAQADGIKVHTGAHDLTIWGTVTCTAKRGGVHQDGVQAMGGERVTAEWLRVRCPTGNNGGFFVKRGRGEQSIPTDIVCDHCDLYEGNAAAHIGYSIRSGIRVTVMWQGLSKTSPPHCARLEPTAIDPVNVDNRCLNLQPPAGK